MTTQHLNTGILTGLHLTVDGLCACCVFMMVPQLGAHHAFLLFMAYNALAFLTQPFVGLWVDRLHRTQIVFKASLALLTGGATISALTSILPSTSGSPTLPYLACLLFGLGNALFHVFGGKSVTVQTDNDMRHLGIFVSSGAIGLVVGERFATVVGLIVITLCMTLLAALLLMVNPTAQGRGRTYPVRRHGLRHSTTYTSLFLFVLLIVFIRSFIGRMLPADEGNATLYAVLLGLLAFLGKSLGGYLGRMLGTWHTLTVTLLLSGVFFLLSPLHVAYRLAMMLTINLTMPLTLYLANRQMPNREGFAFGMLAAMLIPGTMLGTYCNGHPLAILLLSALIATIVIEALVLLAIREYRWQVVGMSVVMNILTNLPLNLFLLANPALHASLPAQIALECGVMAVEALMYALVVHDVRKAFSYALLCNVISYLSGLLFTYLY